VKFDVIAETRLPKINTPSTSSIVVFRFNRENNNGIVGPEIAMASAKKTDDPPCFGDVDLKLIGNHRQHPNNAHFGI